MLRALAAGFFVGQRECVVVSDRQIRIRRKKQISDTQRSTRGHCYLQDIMYLRGTLLINRLVAEDKTILDHSPQPLRELAYDPDLDNYILTFEATDEDVAKPE